MSEKIQLSVRTWNTALPCRSEQKTPAPLNIFEHGRETFENRDRYVNCECYVSIQTPTDLIEKFVHRFDSSLPVNNQKMAPSASKQKRLAEKAAKKNAGGGPDGADSPSTSTPAGSVNGASTPLTSMSGMNSKAGSSEDLMSMAKLNIATDRYGFYSRSLWILTF